MQIGLDAATAAKEPLVSKRVPLLARNGTYNQARKKVLENCTPKTCR